MQTLFDLKNKYTDRLEHLSYLVLKLPSLVFFLFFGIFLVNLSDRGVPATLYDGRMIVQNVHPGDTAIFEFKVDRTRICEVSYTELLYDSQGTRFPLVDYPAFKNKRKIATGDILRIGIELPRGMSPGPAVYQSEREYICNFTQRWISPLTVENPDIHFNVEPRP